MFKFFKNTKLFYIFKKSFTTNSNTNVKITNAIVFKEDLDTENNLNNLTKNENLLAEPAQVYYDILDQHFRMRIPFSDENYYKDLLKISSQITNNSGLESWDVLDRYAILNIESGINKEFLTNLIEQFAKIKFTKYEVWYLSEKFIIKNIQEFTNQQLSTLIYSYGINDKGSNYIFQNFSREVLNRKIRNFTEEEFVKIYVGFKSNKIKDKLLCAILERAKIELYPNLNIEDINE